MATPGLSSCSKKENFFQPKPMAISPLAFQLRYYSVRAALQGQRPTQSYSKNAVIMTIPIYDPAAKGSEDFLQSYA